MWEDLVVPDAGEGVPSFSVLAIHNPHHTQPLLLAPPLPIPSQGVRDLYRDRWPIEQLPLAAKQMLGHTGSSSTPQRPDSACLSSP